MLNLHCCHTTEDLEDWTVNVKMNSSRNLFTGKKLGGKKNTTGTFLKLVCVEIAHFKYELVCSWTWKYEHIQCVGHKIQKCSTRAERNRDRRVCAKKQTCSMLDLSSSATFFKLPKEKIKTTWCWNFYWRLVSALKVLLLCFGGEKNVFLYVIKH